MGNYKSHSSFSNKADVVGIVASSVCIIHCLLTPFVAVLFSGILKEKYELLNFVFLLVSLISVVLSVRSSKHNLFKGLFIYFWVQLSVALVFEDVNIIFTLMMYFAAIGLIVTHVLNIKHCKKCHH